MLIKTKKPSLSKSFPQANDVYRIIKFVDNYTFSYYNKFLYNIKMNLVRRQVDYYKSAANYLGLLDGNKPTTLAEHIFKLDKDNMLINICQLILENEVFYNYYKYRNSDKVIEYLKNVYHMKDSTAKRRFSTVKAWVNWCDIIIKENNIVVEGE